jgi:hypothetical protein
MQRPTILIIIIFASILAGLLIPKKAIYSIFENSGYYFVFVSLFYVSPAGSNYIMQS